jgi:hypothetical protein
MCSKNSLKNKIDLSIIFHLIAQMTNGITDSKHRWVKLNNTNTSGFNIHLIESDPKTGNSAFYVYPVKNKVTDTTKHLLSHDDFTEDELDEAYRNALTCRDCSAEFNFCECDDFNPI